MKAPLAYLDGEWLPFDRLSIPISDAGFVLGTTVTEQLRTLGGRLFRLEDHLARLARSMEIVGLEVDRSIDELAQIARDAVARNWSLVDEGSDLGLGIFVTPGPYATLAPRAEQRARVCVYAYPLAFEQWASKYETGQALAISSIRQVPTDCWPAELKCRSRMHYYLADRDAAQRYPGSRAVLLDQDGFLSEASTASVVLYREGEGVVSPRSEKILPGISLMTLLEIAAERGIPQVQRDIPVDELRAADEIWLASTSICLQAVTRLDGQPISQGAPGPVFRALLAAWSEQVGVDIAAQAKRFARSS
ncbi:MAG: aminotransferase class IV [Planctomycetales bacterium]|nr:aminotransferase class IV [Planctomycetales bacterium]